MATKEFTIAEVAAHNSATDIYITIRDQVYDLTKFAAEVRKTFTFYQKNKIHWPQFLFSMFQHPGETSSIVCGA